ncbi:MAG TPA: hypothetical protein VM870_07280 [Pyrinomonadaceae bacterium]|jgi:hypothetical protein|nr:hypothetical protein [Pyrinomonadaceae bacterium]
MGLIETQRILARLYTSAPMRRRLLEEPARIAAEFGLSEVETRELTHLFATAPPHFFADTLISKRRREVGKLLPVTSRALGDRFAEFFAAYAENEALPPDAKKHSEDALSFAHYLQRVVAKTGGTLPDWLPDVLRYEAGWLEMSRGGRKVLARVFRYHVHQFVVEQAHRIELTGGPSPGRSVSMWVRRSDDVSLKHYNFNWPSP